MTLFKDPLSNKLTSPNSAQDALSRASFPGMAHFAGTGPNGRTCRECTRWQHTKWDYFSKISKHHGQIRPATCDKYKVMTGQTGAKVPDDAAACKYFEFNVNTPKRFS